MIDDTITSAFFPFLRRTLNLAGSGQGTVFSGPWFGWVLANGGRIVAEGSTKSALLQLQSTQVPEHSLLFLSINPFPTQSDLSVLCTNLSLKRYYVATTSESPVRREAVHLNRRFLTWQQQKRPYLILKWAETADGFIAPTHSEPYWISNAHARRLVHQWRTQEAAIWVGKSTCHQDNPRLNARFWVGPDPLRIVIDPQLQLNAQLHVFDQAQPTLCYNNLRKEVRPNLTFAKIPENCSSWKERVRFVLDDLYARQIQSVLVEGGATLLSFLLNQGWWDEARVFQAPITFEEGLPAPRITSPYGSSQQRVGGNTLTIYRNR